SSHRFGNRSHCEIDDDLPVSRCINQRPLLQGTNQDLFTVYHECHTSKRARHSFEVVADITGSNADSSKRYPCVEKTTDDTQLDQIFKGINPTRSASLGSLHRGA